VTGTVSTVRAVLIDITVFSTTAVLAGPHVLRTTIPTAVAVLVNATVLGGIFTTLFAMTRHFPNP
jgi:hypothetical protein